MNEIVKDLGLDNCIKIPLGKVELLLDNFRNGYQGIFGTDNIIIKSKNNYYKYGYNFYNNNIIEDLQNKRIKVINLEEQIRNTILKLVEKGLERYYEENKNKQLYNADNIYVWRNFSRFGKSPIDKIKEVIEYHLCFDKLTEGKIIINWLKSSEILYNLEDNKLYLDNDSNEETDNIIFNYFCGDNSKNLYVLYKNYLNNSLIGKDLTYKEIADLNNWLEKDNKSNITVIYEKDGEEKEEKIQNNIDNMLSTLPKEYYEEMFSFWGVDDIKSIKQIKGFKYRKDFYKWNVENLLYKKESV